MPVAIDIESAEQGKSGGEGGKLNREYYYGLPTMQV